MQPVDTPTIICITPVKDEAWIIDRFCRAASLWADHILLADQQSTDETTAIAARHPRVKIIDNPIPRYDEAARQKLLLDAARKLPLIASTTKRMLIALDADEALSANFRTSPEWLTLQAAAPGTVLSFNWVNLQPDFRSAWIPDIDLPLGYMDDGAEHTGTAIHNWRVPTPANAPRIVCHDIKVLHYQYTDWQRMKSKHRWYQCYERLTNPAKSAIDIFRQYHHMYAIPEKQKVSLDPQWFKLYQSQNIDMTSVTKFSTYYWDTQIADLLAEHGPEKFATLDIWHLDYESIYQQSHGEPPPRSLKDPRTPEQKETNNWLRATQSTAATDPAVQKRDAELKALGW